MSIKTFGRNLKYYRTILGMTQQDLADSTGVTRGSIANYEISRSEPEFEFVCKAAAVLGVSLDELMTDHEYGGYTRRLLVTDEESELIRIFRDADPVYQNVALDILKSHRRQE